MKYTSQIIATGSGSVGGCTYSHNRAGQYIRRRAMPVNPGSVFAQVMTASLANLVARWDSVLTQAQRDAWDAIAFGSVQTGLTLYIRMNSLRLQFAVAVIDDPPLNATVAALTPPVATAADDSAQTYTVSFTDTDQWATEVGGYLGIFASRPQSPTINYFKGPYRLVELITGAVVPPPSPHVTTAGNTPFPFVTGQRVFFQFRAVQADGRISGVSRAFVLATA